jgi:chromodomain-helicase-DNA-binding protein 7
MDSFNSPDRNCFVFVLRTQSGNAGTDLRSADVAIIYDGDDWTPGEDLAATIRYGITRGPVYRLLTANTVERVHFDRNQSPPPRKIDELEAVIKEASGLAVLESRNEDIDTILARSSRRPLAGAGTKDGEQSGWSRHVFSHFVSVLGKFGVGRWELVRQHLNLPCSLDYVQTLGFVVLKWIVEATPDPGGSFDMIKTVYIAGLKIVDSEKLANEYEKMKDIVLRGTARKLILFELLRVLDHELRSPVFVVAATPAKKPAPWWTVDDDRALLFNVWMYGFQEYVQMQFGENERPPDERLTHRAESLLTQMRLNFIKSFQNDPEFIQAMEKARNFWSVADFNHVFFGLMMFGCPDTERLAEAIEYSRRNSEKFGQFVNRILEVARELVDDRNPCQGDLPTPITQNDAGNICARVQFFAALRARKDLPGLLPEDKRLLEYVSAHGLMRVAEQRSMALRFAAEDVQGAVVAHIRDLLTRQYSCAARRVQPLTDEHPPPPTEDSCRGPPARNSSQRAPVKHLPRHPRPEDPPERLGGAECVSGVTFPWTLSGSLVIYRLGKCIWDRPGFHCERYLYPAGFESHRLFASVLDPRERIWYRSSIRAGQCRSFVSTSPATGSTASRGPRRRCPGSRYSL